MLAEPFPAGAVAGAAAVAFGSEGGGMKPRAPKPAGAAGGAAPAEGMAAGAPAAAGMSAPHIVYPSFRTSDSFGPVIAAQKLGELLRAPSHEGKVQVIAYYRPDVSDVDFHKVLLERRGEHSQAGSMFRFEAKRFAWDGTSYQGDGGDFMDLWGQHLRVHEDEGQLAYEVYVSLSDDETGTSSGVASVSPSEAFTDDALGGGSGGGSGGGGSSSWSSSITSTQPELEVSMRCYFKESRAQRASAAKIKPPPAPPSPKGIAGWMQRTLFT
jgi:hypothetical protein